MRVRLWAMRPRRANESTWYPVALISPGQFSMGVRGLVSVSTAHREPIAAVGSAQSVARA
eukprot:2246267-Rhodomonas_salina.1